MKRNILAGLAGTFGCIALGLMLCGPNVLADDTNVTPTATPAMTEEPLATAEPIMTTEPATGSAIDINPNSINATNFPDSAFRDYVLKTFDADGDKILSDKEMAAVTTIDLTNKGVNSLKGIEKFTSLRTLKCSGNNINTIDLSHNKRLSTVDVSGNRLVDIDLSANTSIYSLNVSNNDIVLLDVSSCAMLIDLDCSNNELIDVVLPAGLKILNCSNNNLSDLDTGAVTGLRSLFASDNNIYSIVLSGNTELEDLDLSGNKLSFVDLSANTKLTPEYVNVSNNVREAFVNEENIAKITGTGYDPVRVGKATGATFDTEKGFVIEAGDKLPEKVTYTYNMGKDLSAEFSFVPVKTRKLFPSVKVLNMYYAENGEQSIYPVTAIPIIGTLDINWSCADSSIAKVSADGKVTPVSVGSTIITASAEGYDSAVIEVNVFNKTSDVAIDEIPVQYYTGQEVKPEPVVKVYDKLLVNNTDYTLSYKNNIDAGEATVVINGKGTYRFVAEKTFKICYDIASLKAEIIPDQAYTGSPITPDIVLYNGETQLVKDTDYTLSYSNNTAIGTGIVTVNGIGRYTGIRIQSFNIVVPQVQNLKKTGNYKTKLILTWDTIPEADGYRIYKYNPSTKKYAYLKQLNGSTTNTYTDSGLTAATQYRYRVRAFVLINNVKTYGKYSSKYIICTKPAKVSLTAKAGTKKATLSWKKITGATGYRVYMSTSGGAYKKVKTITKGSTVSYTKTGLKKGTKYSFKVRAYKTAGDVKVYGKYSSVKSITAK